MSSDNVSNTLVPLNSRFLNQKKQADNLNMTSRLENNLHKFNMENIGKFGSLALWTPDTAALMTKLKYRVKQTKMTRYGGVISPRILSRKLKVTRAK